MMYHYGYFSPFNAMFNVLGWVIVAIVIIWLLKAVRGKDHMHWKDFRKDGAMDILREKYAKGEITKEEFETKKKDLS